MGKILEIFRCDQCTYCLYLLDSLGEWVCIKNNDKQIEDLCSIPDWCPLEDKKGGHYVKQKSNKEMVGR